MNINPIIIPPAAEFSIAQAATQTAADMGDRFHRLTGQAWPEATRELFGQALKHAERAGYTDAQWAERTRLMKVSNDLGDAAERADYALEDAQATFEAADKAASAYWSEEIEAELADASKELTRAEAEAKRLNDDYYRSVIDCNLYYNHIDNLNNERKVSCD